MNKVLLIGNSKHVNSIEFDKLNNSLITIGANRIWYKYIPNYLAFTDPEIYMEMIDKKINIQEHFKNCNIISNDWFMKKAKNEIKQEIRKSNVVAFYSVLQYLVFPDTVSCALMSYHNYIKDTNIKNPIYYVAGVELRYDSKNNHFWTGDKHVRNNRNEAWYTPRFNKMFNNWLRFKQLGLNIISVTPGSRLNEIFPYQDIKTLYT